MAKNIDVGVAGVSRTAKAGYVGVAGVARQFAGGAEQLKYVGSFTKYFTQYTGPAHTSFSGGFGNNLTFTPDTNKTYLLCDSAGMPCGTLVAKAVAVTRPVVLDETTKIYEIAVE